MCIHDIEMTDGDLVTGILFDRKFSKNARENGFIHKLTIKIYSSLSNIIICSYLKLPIPIMHRQFFRTIFINRECVQNFCYVINNPFHFACQTWIINQLFEN